MATLIESVLFLEPVVIPGKSSRTEVQCVAAQHIIEQCGAGVRVRRADGKRGKNGGLLWARVPPGNIRYIVEEELGDEPPLAPNGNGLSKKAAQ